MRLRADNEELAPKLRATLLDGKVVPMVYEADEEEGWVKSWMPALPDGRAENGEEIIKDEAKMAGFDLVKRSGNVKLIFWDAATLAGRQDQ